MRLLHLKWTISVVPQCAHRYEEAATLVLAREHFVDFFDFDISEVVFLCEAECAPVVIVLKNVSDGERGIGKDAEEKCDEAYFG